MAGLIELAWAFDILLGLGLMWLAGRALASADLFTAIVLFVAFGLVMALAWVRLDAPDIALAEAAVGAGLTGALLLAALARLPIGARTDRSELRQSRPLLWLIAGLVSPIAAGIGYAIWTLPAVDVGLSSQVAANLRSSGVDNAVTAVLLNFRSFDTLLEIMVLLVAVVAVWSFAMSSARPISPPGPVLDVLARLLMPVFILVAAYLVWAGAAAPGGAFQAGAVLGAGGVLLLLAGWPGVRRGSPFAVRLVLVAGGGIFVIIAVLTLLAGGRLLQYPVGFADEVILILEIVASASIGVTLAALFFIERPKDAGGE